MKTKIETDKAPKATGLFSQAVVVDKMIYTSGQIYLTPEGKLLEGTIENKTNQIMKNLQAMLLKILYLPCVLLIYFLNP